MEGSSGVRLLVTLLATCRVRTLALRGEPPSDQQMGLEVTNIRRHLSTAAVRAASTVLLATFTKPPLLQESRLTGGGSPNLVVLVEWKVPVERFMGAANCFH